MVHLTSLYNVFFIVNTPESISDNVVYKYILFDLYELLPGQLVEHVMVALEDGVFDNAGGSVNCGSFFYHFILIIISDAVPDMLSVFSISLLLTSMPLSLYFKSKLSCGIYDNKL